MRIVLFIVFAFILFGLLYDIYKTKSYKRPRQIIWAIAGTLVLVYILYTCKRDN